MKYDGKKLIDYLMEITSNTKQQGLVDDGLFNKSKINRWSTGKSSPSKEDLKEINNILKDKYQDKVSLEKLQEVCEDKSCDIDISDIIKNIMVYNLNTENNDYYFDFNPDNYSISIKVKNIENQKDIDAAYSKLYYLFTDFNNMIPTLERLNTDNQSKINMINILIDSYKHPEGLPYRPSISSI